jgi:hypothetical protein
VDILLPLDSVCPTDNGVIITNCDNEPKMNTKERDCGPATWRRNADAIHAAKTIIWNGPLGQIELPMYRNGTMDARDHVVKATKRGAITIVLGQDMVNNVFKDHLDKVTHWNNWSWPSWSLIVDKKLLGIDTLSRCDGVCACVRFLRRRQDDFLTEYCICQFIPPITHCSIICVVDFFCLFRSHFIHVRTPPFFGTLVFRLCVCVSISRCLFFSEDPKEARSTTQRRTQAFRFATIPKHTHTG